MTDLLKSRSRKWGQKLRLPVVNNDRNLKLFNPEWSLAMKRKNLRNATLSVAALTAAMIASTSALAQGTYGPSPGMGPGMMRGGMMNGDQGGGSTLSRTPAAGSAIFRASCASCHRNGGNVVTPNLPLKGSRKLVDFKTFLDFIRQPTMPDGSKGAMPAFSKTNISDQQAQPLYKFITETESSGKAGN
jgi:mono/diheme cytochrome c family protein